MSILPSKIQPPPLYANNPFGLGEPPKTAAGNTPIGNYGYTVAPSTTATPSGVQMVKAPAPAPTPQAPTFPSAPKTTAPTLNLNLPAFTGGGGGGGYLAPMPEEESSASGPAMAGFEAAMSGAGYLGANGNMLNGSLGVRKPPFLRGLRESRVGY